MRHISEEIQGFFRVYPRGVQRILDKTGVVDTSFLFVQKKGYMHITAVVTFFIIIFYFLGSFATSVIAVIVDARFCISEGIIIFVA